jgi:hypothetical protein
MRKLLPLLLAIAACGNVPNGLGGGGGGDGGGGNGDSGGGGGDGGNRGGNDAGGSGSGSGSGITTTGLTFGIVGDTRPSSETTGTSGYPTTIINTIFQDLENASPKPSFVIATGDYEFIYPPGSEDSGPGPGYGASDGCTCNTAMSDGGPSVSSGQCGQQCLYWKARSEYSGPFWPAMGNHECTGADVSNCAYGKGTLNLADWIGVMLTPIGETSPYYSKTVTASDNSWTAKFIITACNAWDSTQASWLTAQLAQSTTYTFVIRHESAEDINSGDSGSSYPCKASQTAIDGATMTLLVVGHTHEYAHYASSKEIVNGLGGAPLTSGDNYGYTIVNRNSDGTLTVTTYDYMGGSTLDSFKINADGSPAP